MTTATANQTVPQTEQPGMYCRTRACVNDAGAELRVVASPLPDKLTPEAKAELVSEFLQFIDSMDMPYVDSMVVRFYAFPGLRTDGGVR